MAAPCDDLKEIVNRLAERPESTAMRLACAAVSAVDGPCFASPAVTKPATSTKHCKAATEIVPVPEADFGSVAP